MNAVSVNDVSCIKKEKKICQKACDLKTVSAVFLVITMIISGQGDDGVKIKLIWISSEDVRI